MRLSSSISLDMSPIVALNYPDMY